MNSFSNFELLPTLLKTLKEKQLVKPTEIQAQAIPLIMQGKSIVAVAETGSGKTLAYALPLLHMIKTLELQGDPVQNHSAPRALVMVPTRELGEQVSKVLKTLTHDTRLRVRPALGGMEMAHARRNTEGMFEVLLATPGRLVEMLERKWISLKDVRVLVFDEADQMLDQGFLPDSNLIVSACPQELQLALFSATVSTAVQEMMNQLFANATVIRSKGSGKVVSSLTTKNLTVVDGKRWPLFEKVLMQRSEGGTIVFANTREQCDKLAKELSEKSYACAIYRGEMDKRERRVNLKKFRDGEVDILVSTDLGGRGLDIENVGRVINFHLPKELENYLHRVGRTARAGKPGLVINLVTERDQRLMERLDNVPSSEKRQRQSAAGSTSKDSKSGDSKSSTNSGGKFVGKASGHKATPAPLRSANLAAHKISQGSSKPSAHKTASGSSAHKSSSGSVDGAKSSGKYTSNKQKSAPFAKASSRAFSKFAKKRPKK